MKDIPTFLAFAGDGRFSDANLSPTITPGTDVAAGLNTFLTSRLMQANHIYAIPSASTMDQATFESNTRFTLKNGSPCIQSNSKAFYWSPVTKRQYQLQVSNFVSILLTGITQHGWADASLLFDGNYNCTARGNAGKAIVSLDAEGGIDYSCVSQLPIYLDCGTPCPTDVRLDGRCPFGNWKSS
ncbi:MAG: hypothetical protein Q9218_003603 [Villophora microphyllina]